MKGVGQVNVGGGALPAVRVDINPTVLNQYGLDLEDVRATLASANANRPKGELAEPTTLLVRERHRSTVESRRVPAIDRSLSQGGGALRLADVATVTDSVENIRTGGLANGKPAVLIIVFRQPGANIIDTVDGVRALLPELRALIPPAVKLSVVQNATTTIRASVRDVKITMLISIALVILVVFLFLRSVRSTIIPSIAVPVSLVGTFGVMYLLGYSIDNLSLMALTIATGFVVDDAIVVIENITRHLEQGITPLQAALQGAREIGFTVISISVSLVAVFIPILHDGRHRRPPVSRVCRDAFRRHCRIDVGIADDHADDVRAAAAFARQQKDTVASTKPARGRFNGCSAATRRRFPGYYVTNR